jgi:POT family proton-dependent oligopeptide transporter
LFSIGIGIIILLVGFKSRFWENLPSDNPEETNNTVNSNNSTANTTA